VIVECEAFSENISRQLFLRKAGEHRIVVAQAAVPYGICGERWASPQRNESAIPADRQCKDCGPAQFGEANSTCTKCKVPFCRECKHFLEEAAEAPRLPPPALRNDNVFGLPPRLLYDLDVTPAELLLASPYKPGALHFDVEGTHVHVGVHDPAGKKAFRGNAVFFPLAMEAIFAAVSADEDAPSLHIPHDWDFSLGSLSEIFTVTIRGPGDGKKQAARIATVRRSVVRQLVEEMRRRRHPAYFKPR
jgi:hypothetical protein